MTSNVLPLFWNLASSSKDTRLTASADLVSTLEGFQENFLATREEEPSSDDEPDQDDDLDGSDEDEDEEARSGMQEDGSVESGLEVDGSETGSDSEDHGEASRLDDVLAKNNAEDVTYTIKRLVRGLASSRESSRLGFAVALTELLSRIHSITPATIISLLIRNTPLSKGMKGTEERDMLFARLFGFTALVNSGLLWSSNASFDDFNKVLVNLIKVGRVKGWLRESAWWGIISALNGIYDSQVSWKEQVTESVLNKLQAEEGWSQEKLAAVLLLERKAPNVDLTKILRPTFKHSPILASGNLTSIARILKDVDADDDADGGATTSTGTWKPQLHFAWNLVFDAYFAEASSSSGQAPFPALFNTVVDESLFANTSSPQKRYWGFQVFQRALPLCDADMLPQLFTPNFMRCWINNLSSSDRYLHKAAQRTAKVVQEVVSSNPRVGFALLSKILGKNGRPDFDRVTKTKTVEGIMGSLTVEGVEEYVRYLQGVILEGDEQNADSKALSDRRQWAIDQVQALCKNTSVPKDDAWIGSVIDFFLVHGFFTIKKPAKKSNILALQTVPQPPLSETSSAACRSRLFNCLAELTVYTPVRSSESVPPVRLQGCDLSGKLWLRRALDTLSALEADSKHVEPMLDADDEIKASRKKAIATLRNLSKQATGDNAEVAKGVEILLSFVLLQTYDENADALDTLDDVVSAAESMFGKSGTTTGDDEAPPIDVLLDTLIALLDKGSSDLRSLATLVLGMVAPAFTSSSIQHLVAQLEQTVAEVAAAEMEEEIEDDEDDDLPGSDQAGEEDQEDEDEEEEDEEDDEDEEDEEGGDSDTDIEVDEEEEMGDVDPEFRKRVAAALKLSGMGDEDSDSQGGDDSDAESEVWDDDQMMKVDEQLAEVFRQRAGKAKKAKTKNLQMENIHFKTRILDLFDTFARKQSTNPLVLELILPLLRLARHSSVKEKDLADKSANILRTRLGKAKDVPVLADKAGTASLLKDIHDYAKRADSADFSSLCSICSIFVSRCIDTSHPTSTDVKEIYGSTIDDFLSRKSSLVHHALILDYIKRYPTRAWALRDDILRHLDSSSGVNTYRKVQAYGMLQIFVTFLPTISKAVPNPEITDFIGQSSKVVYSTLQGVMDGNTEWKADKLKEVLKFALALARASKNVLGVEQARAAWDAQRLSSLKQEWDQGEKTKSMKGISGMIGQVVGVLRAEGEKKEKKNKVKVKAKAKDDKMEVDGEDVTGTDAGADPAVTAEPVAEKVVGVNGKEKKRKSIEGAKKVKLPNGDKPKKVKIASS